MTTTNGNTVVRTTTLEPRKDQEPVAPPAGNIHPPELRTKGGEEDGELTPPPQPQKRGRKPRAQKAAATDGPTDAELIALGKLTLHATRIKCSPTEYITAVKELSDDLRKFGYGVQADVLKADLDAWAALTLEADPKG